jgi:serine/threonine-protein kinase
MTSTQAAGTVISQTPNGGTALPRSTVALVIAKAPNTAKVPNVIGFSGRAARRQLRSAGFSVAEQYQTVKNQGHSGVVLSENPNHGTTQPKRSTVTIVIGKYKGSGAQTGTGTNTTTTTTGTATSPTSTTIGGG